MHIIIIKRKNAHGWTAMRRRVREKNRKYY